MQICLTGSELSHMLLIQVRCLLQLTPHLVSFAAQILQLNCMLSLLCFKLLLNLQERIEHCKMANNRQQLVEWQTNGCSWLNGILMAAGNPTAEAFFTTICFIPKVFAVQKTFCSKTRPSTTRHQRRVQIHFVLVSKQCVLCTSCNGAQWTPPPPLSHPPQSLT